jgi:hypothetical protein
MARRDADAPGKAGSPSGAPYDRLLPRLGKVDILSLL